MTLVASCTGRIEPRPTMIFDNDLCPEQPVTWSNSCPLIIKQPLVPLLLELTNFIKLLDQWLICYVMHTYHIGRLNALFLDT